MKLLSASAILFTSAMADKWGQLGDLWNGVSQNENLSEDDRKIIELFTISSVANYGCWCRFNNYKPYKGHAQDTVDEACMQWYKNYDCLHLDYSTNTPWFRCNIDTPYNDTLTKLQEPFELATDYMSECATENPNDDCAAVACAVDAEFIRHVFLYLADNTLNMTLSGWYGFDGSVCNPGARDGSATTVAPGTTAAQANPTTAPGGTTAAPEPTLDCCGAYPNRYPYKLQSGNRACCVDTTYNVQILECCPSNALLPIGTC
jgi:hypothetical protein